MMRQLLIPVAVALACVFVDVYWLGVPITMYGLGVAAFVGLVQLAKGALRRDTGMGGVHAKRVAVYGG